MTIQDLEQALGRTGSVSAGDVKPALTRLLLELRERRPNASSHTQAFFSAALRALSRIKGQSNATLRLECLFECFHFFHLNGMHKEALATCPIMARLSEGIGDPFWVRRTANLTGIVLADTGNIADAISQYAASMYLAKELNDIYSEVSVLINIGAALNYAGLYKEAIPCLQRAIALCSADEKSRLMAPAAYGNLAQSFRYLGEFVLGFEAISTSLKLSSLPTAADEYLSWTIREFTFVQLALEMNKVTEAREHAARCQECGRLSKSLRGEFVGDVAAAVCEVYGGDVTAGLTALEEALRSRAYTPAFRLDALMALTKAYDYAEKPEKALACVEQLLKQFREFRVGAMGSLTQLVPSEPTRFHEETDFKMLTYRQAIYRSKVAELEVASTRLEMFERLAVTADLKEDASGEHGYRVGKLANLLATSIGMEKDSAFAIEIGARLHDIGKTAVPDRILLSKSSLAAAERHFVSAHTLIGAEILSEGSSKELRMAEEIARHHHEWWNGEGYPAKLKGKRIPIHARIVALADVFDALTHGRPYADPWPIEKALEEIRARSGTQFDPELTGPFIDLVQRLRKEHMDLDEYLGRAGRNSPFLQARRRIRAMLADELQVEREAAPTHH